MKKKILNTLITTSIFAGTILGNTTIAAANEAYANDENRVSDYNQADELLRVSHGDLFPVKHSIMGGHEVSADAFKAFFKAQQDKYGFEYKLTCSLDEWIDTVYEEAKIEGVRADIVIAQAIKETGYFKFGGLLTYKDNNFAGIGVTGASGAKESFPTARIGIRAQVQHLKAYGSTDSLVQACVDPRFNLVSRGSAPSLEELAGRWAYPGYSTSKYSSLKEAAKSNASYGQEIYKLIEQARAYEGSRPTNPDVEKPDTSNPTAPTLIAKGKVKVNTKLNIRSGAGTNYTVVGELKNNQNVNIYEKLNGWYKIDYSVNGKTNYGYVSSKYVSITDNVEKPTNPDTSKPDIPNTGSGIRQGQVINISSRLNVRSGAGTNYSVVTQITNNTKLTINSEKNGWYYVTLSNGTKGYVSSKYVKVISSSGNDSNNNGSGETIKRGKVTGISSTLNVRSGPSISSARISYLRNGAIVEIIGESGNWYKIKSNKASNAYVSKDYIDII
ncbi:MAG: SH3 domain-containing protein [Sarcina sp.]